MPHLQIHDNSIFYQRSGIAGAPAIVLAHALGMDANMWLPQIATLEQHYDVIRYDLRGHGKSSVTTGPYTLSQLGNDVIDLIDGLALNKVVFCGLSIGSGIAQWLALNAPQRLSAIVLCNSAAKFGVAEIWDQRIAAVVAGGMAGFVENFIDRGFSPAFRNANPQLIASLHQQFIGCSAEGYVAACAAARELDFTDRLRSISLPTAIIAGSKDTSTTLKDARYLQSQIVGSTLFEIPGAHISNIEAVTDFNQALLQFLQLLSR